ncbi:hypothetical protein BSK20_02190 [SR1 bacterium human oral taxon HOT-345]|nr:hypothetical protein BSK20_02190 [SR1 bacterium human oral taxon HOT-345]
MINALNNSKEKGLKELFLYFYFKDLIIVAHQQRSLFCTLSGGRYYYSQFFLKMQIFDVFFLCFSKLLFSTAISFMIFGLIF